MKNKKSKLSDRLKLYSCILLPLVGIYFIATYLRGQRENEIKLIQTNFAITSGLILSKTTYKGKSIRVKYIVNNKTYIGSDGFDDKFNFKVGDSIKLKYLRTNPEFMITEFNEEY
jgi:hypothetical protein